MENNEIYEVKLSQNLEKIEFFRTLCEAGWDGENASPLQNQIIDIAKEILPKLKFQPHVVPTRFGDIALEWRNSTKKNEQCGYLSIRILGIADDKYRVDIFNSLDKECKKPSTEIGEYIQVISTDKINKIVEEFMTINRI